MLRYKVRCDEQQLPRGLDPADYRRPTSVRCRTNHLISHPTRITGESTAYPTVEYCAFDIGENQIVVGHLHKEMRESKLIFLLPDLLPVSFNSCHEASPGRNLCLSLPGCQSRMPLDAAGVSPLPDASLECCPILRFGIGAHGPPRKATGGSRTWCSGGRE